MDKHMPSNVWDKVTQTLPKLQWLHRWSFEMDKKIYLLFF